MCGIAGILEFRDGATPDRVALERMTTFMTHRGPDGAGVHVDGPLGLGHRRLSIIDLDHGAQPMLDPTGRYALCFNGEIYNYIELREQLKAAGSTFRTDSDTEVLLEALIRWGADAPAKLNGMFAFAFYDRAERRMMLVRDHLGIKPLYYAKLPDRLMFASDLGAIATHPDFPRALDPVATSHYFTWRTVPNPYTGFRAARQLPPATIMTINADGRETTRTYWDIPVNDRPASATPAEADALEGELRDLLADALRLQVRSDVPVGAFLSGGVDSSTVAYWMKQAVGDRAVTFTIGFRGEEKDFDESEWAEDVARHIGTEHHTHFLREYDIVELLERIAWQYSQPCGTGIPNYFVSEMARKHVTVALAGVGGDECFAGYGRFLLAGNPRATGYDTDDPVHAFLRSLVSFTDADKREFFSPDLQAATRHEPSIGFIRGQVGEAPRRNTLDALCRIDLRHFMLNDLLFNLDKMSMAHSLEVRVPLLDHRIVELAQRTPPRLKVLHGEQKVLLKRAMYRQLPRHVFLRAKRGFSLPKQVWLKRIESTVRDLISERTVRERGLFEWNTVSAYVDRVFDADGRASWRDANNLWNLFSFELWARQFVDQAPDVHPPGGRDAEMLARAAGSGAEGAGLAADGSDRSAAEPTISVTLPSTAAANANANGAAGPLTGPDSPTAAGSTAASASAPTPAPTTTSFPAAP
ncbi:MAG: asparagine synthase (glutamine-hydrolyzing) [Phycisphaerales bacterium]